LHQKTKPLVGTTSAEMLLLHSIFLSSHHIMAYLEHFGLVG
jgi:hypothetical protein